jgi:hypothetical protein
MNAGIHDVLRALFSSVMRHREKDRRNFVGDLRSAGLARTVNLPTKSVVAFDDAK